MLVNGLLSEKIRPKYKKKKTKKQKKNIYSTINLAIFIDVVM